MANVSKYGNAWKYDRVSWEGLVTANAALISAGKSNREVLHALAIRTLEDTNEPSVPKQTSGGVLKARGIKADELEHSSNTGFGAEWVGIAYSGMFWEDVSERSRILPILPQGIIKEKANEMRVPVQAGDPEFHRIAESEDDTSYEAYIPHVIPTSRIGTAQSRVPVGKLTAAVTWTGEMDEDSVVNFGDAVRMLIRKEAAHVFDSLIINGDTETGATNINNEGTALDSTNVLLTADGFRKFALSNTAYQQDIAGSLGPANISRVLRLTGSDSVDVDDLVVIAPIRAHEQLLTTDTGSDRVNVFDFLRREQGQWSVLGGYQYIPTPDFSRGSPLTASNGNVSATDSDNTRLSVLSVRPDQWMFGYKRNISMHVDYRGRADAYELTTTSRIALASRNGSTTAAALAFNGE